MKKERGFVGLIFLLALLINLILVSASTLKVTSEHPFFLDGNWISAKNLQIGDLLTTSDGKTARITKITWHPEAVDVFNLEAGVFHNFVLQDGLIVHNSNDPKIPREPAQREEIDLSWRGVGSCLHPSENVANNLLAQGNIAKIAKNDLGSEFGFKIVAFKNPETREWSVVFFTGRGGYRTPHHPDMGVYLLKKQGIVPNAIKKECIVVEDYGGSLDFLTELKWQDYLFETRKVNGVDRPYLADFMGFQGQVNKKTGKINFEVASKITDHQVAFPELFNYMSKDFADEAISVIMQRMQEGASLTPNGVYYHLSGKTPPH